MQDMTLSEIVEMCDKTTCEECIFNVKYELKAVDMSSNRCFFWIGPMSWNIEDKKVSCTVINEDKKEIAEKIGELVDSILKHKGSKQ